MPASKTTPATVVPITPAISPTLQQHIAAHLWRQRHVEDLLRRTTHDPYQLQLITAMRVARLLIWDLIDTDDHPILP